MNAERAMRREAIAAQMMATLNGPMGPGESYSDYGAMARDAVRMANALMDELDVAALADTPDADPRGWLAELQIADLKEQLQEDCEKLDALKEFVEGVLDEASKAPELYGPFVALVRDLDAKVGAK